MILTTLQIELLFIVALLLPLILQLVILYGVSRLLWAFSHRRFGRGLWTALALVGVPMHELSHAAAFMLTGAGVQRMVLFAPRGLPEYDGATGVVVPARQPSTLSLIVASIAPFFGCSAVAYLVLSLLLPQITVEAAQVELSLMDVQRGGLLDAVGAVFLSYVDNLTGALFQLNWGDWRTYLAVYLGASLGLGAAPSGQDLKHFFPALLIVLVLLFPVFFVLQVFTSPEAAFALVQTGLGGATLAISTALIYATSFALIALVILLVLGTLLGALRYST